MVVLRLGVPLLEVVLLRGIRPCASEHLWDPLPENGETTQCRLCRCESRWISSSSPEWTIESSSLTSDA